jgi:hypothetical protein
VAFLETLLAAPGLSEADEPFLEAALNDKRKDVRSAAVECLCLLPRSAHAARNIDRLKSLLTLTDQGTGVFSRFKSRRLEITLPESLDKAAIRDGVNAKPPAQQKIGERAYWLMQMIALVQPSHWCERFQCDIATLLSAARVTDYAADLVQAFAAAAIRHHDGAWIAALSSELLTGMGDPERQPIARQLIPSLVAAAPVAVRDSILQELLAASKAAQLDFLHPMLAAVDEWSAETTRLAFALLEQSTEFVAPEYTRPRQTLSHWGPRADVETASRELARILARLGEPSPWKNAIETLQDIIEFRLAMRQELLT